MPNRGVVAAAVGAVAGFVVIEAAADADQLPLALASGLLIPALARRGRPRLVALGLMVAVWIGAIGLLTILPDHIHPAPAVSHSVGWSAYFLMPYQGYQLAAGLAAALVVAAGAAAAIAFRRRGSDEEPEGGVAGRAEEPADGPGLWVVLVAGALVASALVPDLRDVFSEVPGQFEEVSTFITPWDSANHTTWASMVERGLVPMKDFFYPYGYQWTFDLVPGGPVVEWLAQCAQLALAGWALWRLFERRAVRVALGLLAIALITLLPSTDLWRYLPGLLMAIVFAAMGPFPHPRLGRDHLVLGAASLVAALYGLDVLMYGVAGMALVIAGDAIRGEIAWRPSGLLRGVGIDAVPVVAAAAILIATWAIAGTMEGNLRLWGDVLQGSGAYSNQSLGPLAGVSVTEVASILFLLPALLLVAGLLAALPLGGERLPRPATAMLMAGGGFTILLLHKGILRWVGNEIVQVPLLVLLWVAILLWNRRRIAPAVAIGALAVAVPFAVELKTPGELSGFAADTVKGPIRAAHTAKALIQPADVRDRARVRFDRSNYAQFPDATAAELLLRAGGSDPPPPFATIDDAQLLYAFFGQDPPYQIEPYDSSSIDEQREVVERLEAEPPKYVVWLRDYLVQDDVPYEIRTPLVYAWFAERYEPVIGPEEVAATDGGPSSNTTILRRLAPGAEPDFEFWRSELGTTLDLGSIPALSDGDELEPCTDGPDCAPYAIVTGPAPDTAEAVTINVTGPGGESVAVRMNAGPDDGSYAVRLDHLWFWPFVGRSPDVESATDGWEAEMVMLRAADRLY